MTDASDVSDTSDASDAATVYERAGGAEFFFALVERFYERVAADELLRPMYPDDLNDATRHLALFLIQYWGGPPTYAAERGHPRLRARHLPFVIGERERDHWFSHMRAAVLESGAGADVEAAMLDYFANAATFMINAH
ncbi:MAG TPA: globin [Acidimicrobiales bacterium]|nr:globin [Acidimicrobiales bacterium]